jgi:hypothetical protein
MKQSDFLWALYLSEREFIQHHENQRTNASNILAAISAAIMVALGTDQISKEVSVALSLFLICLGLFGYTFCRKLYSLMQLHAARSYEYLNALDKQILEVDVDKMKKAAASKNTMKFSKVGKIGLNRIWGLFHLSILSLGLVNLVFTLIN